MSSQGITDPHHKIRKRRAGQCRTKYLRTETSTWHVLVDQRPLPAIYEIPQELDEIVMLQGHDELCLILEFIRALPGIL